MVNNATDLEHKIRELKAEDIDSMRIQIVLKELNGILEENNKCQPSFTELSGYIVLGAIMKKWSDEIAIQILCLRVLQIASGSKKGSDPQMVSYIGDPHFHKLEETDAATIFQVGIIETLVQAMRKFPTEEALFVEGCLFFLSLANSGNDFASYLVKDVKGLDVITAGLKQFSTNYTAQKACLDLLQNLCSYRNYVKLSSDLKAGGILECRMKDIVNNIDTPFKLRSSATSILSILEDGYPDSDDDVTSDLKVNRRRM